MRRCGVVPVTGVSRQRVMARPEMQAAPPADGRHEPAWDKLIPSESRLNPTLRPATCTRTGCLTELDRRTWLRQAPRPGTRRVCHCRLSPAPLPGK